MGAAHPIAVEAADAGHKVVKEFCDEQTGFKIDEKSPNSFCFKVQIEGTDTAASVSWVKKLERDIDTEAVEIALFDSTTGEIKQDHECGYYDVCVFEDLSAALDELVRLKDHYTYKVPKLVKPAEADGGEEEEEAKSEEAKSEEAETEAEAEEAEEAEEADETEAEVEVAEETEAEVEVAEETEVDVEVAEEAEETEAKVEEAEDADEDEDEDETDEWEDDPLCKPIKLAEDQGEKSEEA